jgi:hypothetical protein
VERDFDLVKTVQKYERLYRTLAHERGCVDAPFHPSLNTQS